eukprot:SAG31_NODE_5038_length_2783_cov_1.986215_3_plen_202_part_00
MVEAQERELEKLRFGASYYPGPDGAVDKPKITSKQQATMVARLAQTDRANKFAPHPPSYPRGPRGDAGTTKEDEGRAAETAGKGEVEGREREDGGHAPEYHELLSMMARAKQWMLTDLGEEGQAGLATAGASDKAKKKRKNAKQWKGRKQFEFVRHSVARREAEEEDALLLQERRKEHQRKQQRAAALPNISSHRQPATVR